MRARLVLARAVADRAAQRTRRCSASPRRSGCRRAARMLTCDASLVAARTRSTLPHHLIAPCPFSSSAPSRSTPSRRRSARPTTCSAARARSSPRRRATSRRCSSSASSAATIPIDAARAAARARRRPGGPRARRGRVVSLARPLPPRPQLGRDARDASRRLLALPPEDSRAVPQRAVRLPRQHRSAPAARRAARRSSKPKLVACDTMNFWIESRRPDLLELLEHVDLITLNDGEARQLTESFNLVKAARWIMERGPKHRDHQEGRARRVHVQRDDRSSSRRRIRSRRCSIRPAPAIRSPAASWAISRAPAT